MSARCLAIGSPIPPEILSQFYQAGTNRAEMHIYIERILQLLPALGIYHLTPQTLATADTKVNSTTHSSTDLNQVFHCRAKGKLTARGRRSQKGFTIFKGSQAVKNPVNSCPERLVKNSAILIETELMAQGEDSPIFTEDYKFSSPSAAAGIIRDRNTNGLNALLTDSNQTLK